MVTKSARISILAHVSYLSTGNSEDEGARRTERFLMEDRAGVRRNAHFVHSIEGIDNFYVDVLGSSASRSRVVVTRSCRLCRGLTNEVSPDEGLTNEVNEVSPDEVFERREVFRSFKHRPHEAQRSSAASVRKKCQLQTNTLAKTPTDISKDDIWIN